MEGGVEMKGKGSNFPLCEEGERLLLAAECAVLCSPLFEEKGSVLLSLQCAVLLKGGEMKGRGKVAACCSVLCCVLPCVSLTSQLRATSWTGEP